MKLKILETSNSKVHIVDEPLDAIELIRQRVAVQGLAPEGFHICYISDIINKYQIWRQHLPRVKPFYGERLRPSYVNNPET